MNPAALVTRFDLLVGVAFGVGAVAVAGLVVLLVVGAHRADRAGRDADRAHEVGSQLDALEAMFAGDDRPRYVREVAPAPAPAPVPLPPAQGTDPLAWLDGLLADAGVTPDMTPREASARIDEVLVDIATTPTPDTDRTLEQIDAALAAVADSVGVERTGVAVRLMCDPVTGEPCALHGDGISCRYGDLRCCPTCPTP